MPRRPTVPCADCGKLGWTGTTSLPPGQYRCQPCRRARPVRTVRTLREPTPRHRIECPCGAVVLRVNRGTYCSRECANRFTAATRRRSVTPIDSSRRQRRARELRAPGLSARSRSRLLAAWQRAGVPCAYCGDAATTVDHVVPLSRGGTNFEGNLAPCCKRCNSSKSDLLLVEWRSRPRFKLAG